MDTEVVSSAEEQIVTNKRPAQSGITSIAVAGYKSISERREIEIRPLTILAGPNSSGKSSIMQALLLLKQTLEAPYDPGALLLNGPLVRFNSADQLLSKGSRGKPVDRFQVEIGTQDGVKVASHFNKWKPKAGFEIERTIISIRGKTVDLRLGMSSDEIEQFLDKEFIVQLKKLAPNPHYSLIALRNRCFLEVSYVNINSGLPLLIGSSLIAIDTGLSLVTNDIRNVIHIPGLRGNPERLYPVSAVGETFPGQFQNYVASIIKKWEPIHYHNLAELSRNLEKLGLTSGVSAEALNDTQVELKVNRMPGNGKVKDMVNIADVGFGVSQTLPVLVALLVARPGQLVYLEQPELHLHPRAQTALAEVIADAARRGVRVVTETHSNLLLLSIQTLVAESRLAPELVKLHWFRRNDRGVTDVTSADLDEAGAFGDWPEDFAEINLRAESRYLDAAEARLKAH